jgi:hypothetical protein
MVYASSGHVLYVESGTLFAQRFDVDRLQLVGEAIRLADGLDYYRSTGVGEFSVSDAGRAGAPRRRRTPRAGWFDRGGNKVGSSEVRSAPGACESHPTVNAWRSRSSIPSWERQTCWCITWNEAARSAS